MDEDIKDGGGRDDDGQDGGDGGGQHGSGHNDDGLDDDRGGGGGHRGTQPAAPGHRAHSATIGRGRVNAWQARWAEAALAGGAGADFTCRFPRSGRVDDAHRARPSLRRSSLTLKMISTSPCL